MMNYFLRLYIAMPGLFLFFLNFHVHKGWYASVTADNVELCYLKISMFHSTS